MKKTLRFLTLGIATLIGIAAFSMPVFAQDDAAKKTDECNKIYNEKFLANYKTNQPQALLDGKEYLQKCAGFEADIEKFVKNWVIKYEWLKLKADFDVAFNNVASGKSEYPNVFKYGKEILAKTPEQMAELVQLKVATGSENITTIMKMGVVGYYAEKAKTTTYRDESSTYTKQALQLLDSGKAPEKWDPFKDKDDAYSWLNFTLGYMWKEASPKDAAAYFYKTLNYNSSLKTNPATYIYMANFYEAEYRKQVKKNEIDFPAGTPETDASKAADEVVNAWMDRWADSLARAVSLAKAEDPKDAWTKTLKEIFKARYNLADEPAQAQAVNEYIAKVQSKPLPDPATEPKPDPVREVKQDATTTTGAKETGAVTGTTATTDVAVGNGNGNGTTPKMNGANGATTTTPAKATPAKKAPAKGKAKKPTR